MIQRLKTIGLRIAAIETAALLSLVYVLFVPFMAFVMRRKKKKSGWGTWEYTADTLSDVQREH